MIQAIGHWIGFESFRISHLERLVSMLGAFCGIALVYLVSSHFAPGGAGVLVASMGASAVLVFAVPHGALSQPWPLVAGHLVSAVIGVSCAAWVPSPVLAAPLAVALAVVAMHYLRCIHPPGGATALAAVIGGPQIQALGYDYVWLPVLVNVLLLLVVGVVFNFFFAWRRYPAALVRLARPPADVASRGIRRGQSIAHEDFVYALSEIDSFVDITEDDLLRIYELATRPSEERSLTTPEIAPDRCYSNGRYGNQWSVRRVTGIEPAAGDQAALLAYKVVAGAGRRQSAVVPVEEFARWARYEVFRDEDNWRRVGEE